MIHRTCQHLTVLPAFRRWLQRTSLRTLGVVIACLALASSASAATSTIYETSLEHGPGGILICTVSFTNPPPPPATVDKILRSSLETAMLVDSSNNILTVGFVGHTTMTPNQCSGAIIYKASEKRIMSMDEYKGVKASGQDGDGYFIKTEENKTLDGIKPERHWRTLTLVYPSAPALQDAYDALLKEVGKAASAGLDINAYIDVGDKTTPTTWVQMKDPDGGYVFVGYHADTKTIERKSKVLKVLP